MKNRQNPISRAKTACAGFLRGGKILLAIWLNRGYTEAERRL